LARNDKPRDRNERTKTSSITETSREIGLTRLELTEKQNAAAAIDMRPLFQIAVTGFVWNPSAILSYSYSNGYSHWPSATVGGRSSSGKEGKKERGKISESETKTSSYFVWYGGSFSSHTS
jgi:hypothetical protein